ncbi:MAG: DUF6599 family protein [Bryobacterales bacterium]|nr:hypothetical protein [Bryobacteraceae bacterium]MDW8130321.1 DUF6599 family protein [Bryobacterales bacterium]
MLRRLTFLLLWLATGTVLKGQSALWPDRFGSFEKVSSRPIPLEDAAVWDEYGFQQAEEADYASQAAPPARFRARAWRLKDPTGALAAFQWQRPAKSQPSKLGALAVETGNGAMLAYGNYLFEFEGYKPQVPELEALFDRLPRLDQSAVPTLPSYLPARDLVANSERYVVGPESLAKFAPGIPPSMAAFHLGTEAQLGRYRGPKGEMRLAIFSYPTPQLARERAEAFRSLPGAMVKRAGPLVAVVLSPPDLDAAERLLAAVRYEASVSLSQYVPTRKDLWWDLILNIFLLVGLLLLFCAVGGLAVAGWRMRRKEGEPMIMLHLDEPR